MDADLRIVYVGEKKGKFSHIAEDSGLFDDCRYIAAGKLRRYHNESLFRRLTDIKTIALNLRDLARLFVGTVQAIILFKQLHADSVLLKGGYVCVPASIGAKLSGSFIITHDSDAVPGLSNRIAARYAHIHTTGMPTHYYNYPKETARYVGLPIDQRFRVYSDAEVRFLKEKMDLPLDSSVILVTGGSNGARRLNSWSLELANSLAGKYPKLHVILLIGKGNIGQFERFSFSTAKIKERVHVQEFSSELFHLAAVADVIISRAGATTIAEFGAMQKACVIVPNPDLTGGHQLKNATVYHDAKSAIIVQEKSLRGSAEPLVSEVEKLLNDKQARRTLGKNLSESLPKDPAAQMLASLLHGRSLGP